MTKIGWKNILLVCLLLNFVGRLISILLYTYTKGFENMKDKMTRWLEFLKTLNKQRMEDKVKRRTTNNNKQLNTRLQYYVRMLNYFTIDSERSNKCIHILQWCVFLFIICMQTLFLIAVLLWSSTSKKVSSWI